MKTHRTALLLTIVGVLFFTALGFAVSSTASAHELTRAHVIECLMGDNCGTTGGDDDITRTWNYYEDVKGYDVVAAWATANGTAPLESDPFHHWLSRWHFEFANGNNIYRYYDAHIFEGSSNVYDDIR